MGRNITYINYGVTQDERFPAPLSVDNPLIDQRNLIDLVAFAAKYAGLLNYYTVDADNRLTKDGDWRFFTEHELFLLAEIGTFNMEPNRNQIMLIRTTLSNKDSTLADMIYALRLLFENLMSAMEKLNTWYNRSKAYHLRLAEDLANVISKNIAPHLQTLKAYALYYERRIRLGHYLYLDHKRLEEFDESVWHLPWDYHKIEEKERELNQGTELLEDPRQIITKNYSDVTAIAQIIQYNLNYVINIAREQFDDYLNTHDNIKPDLALLLAFFNLFKQAQDKQNAITKRHLDFYYRDTLRFAEQPLVPDTAILTIQLVPEIPEVLIAAGTAFDGGKDQAGNSVEYTAKETTIINQVKVADLRTLFVAGNAYVKPYFPLENPVQLITGIYSNVQNPASLDGDNGFAVIGEDQLEKGIDQRTMQDVQLGFAVSSPVLFMSGGERRFQVTMYFTENSFNSYFYEPIRNLTQPVKSLSESISLSIDDLFAKIFSDAFAIRLTGEKEWLTVSGYAVTYSKEQCSLQFSFSMDTADPAITAYNSDIHGGQFSTVYPLLAFNLLNTYPYPVYNFLNNLEVIRIELDAEVNNLRNLSLYNQYGKIDTSKPFQPLGVQPEKGAYMLIGSPELFSKQLSNLTVTLNWQSLPVTIEGQQQYTDFYNYYKAYGITPPVTNFSFLLNSSYLQNGRWMPFGDNQGLLLYNEQNTAVVSATINNDAVMLIGSEADGSTATLQYADGSQNKTDGKQELSDTTHLVIKPQQNTITPDDMLLPQMTKPMAFGPDTTYGFMKFELSDPVSGFGAGLYANTLSSALLKNAKEQLEDVLKRKDKGAAAETQDLPKAPYTPLASSISVQYSAKDVINLLPEGKQRGNNSSFFHIDAFSTYEVGLRSAHQPVSKDDKSLSAGGGKDENHLKDTAHNAIGSYRLLVPSYFIQGNLYIGLSGVNAPCSLSMYLVLTEKLVQADTSDVPTVTWSFLSGTNTWVNFTPGKSMTDETYNLTRSGLVKLDLTEDMSSTATILPTGLFWLRAQVTQNLNIFSRLLYVYTQVIEVIYSNPETSQRSDLILPAGTISKSTQLIPGVKTIQQPLPSANGVFPEAERAFYTRVSETLRHKNRAIQAWDFERLVLQNFPQVYKAKCVTASVLNTTGSTGSHFDIVVIPEVKGEGVITNDRFGPVLALSVLEEIEQRIKPMTSPHTRFNVRNPVYEKLVVRCNVRFKTNDSFYIRQLNTDIKSFLSPWLGGSSKQYRIGEGVQKSTILGFIQQLEYVDFVTAFSVIKIARVKGRFHLYDSARYEKEHPDKEDTDMLYALTPWSVFVSAENHLINPVSEVAYTEPLQVGLGDLAIEYDFIIAKDSKRSLPQINAILSKTLTIPEADKEQSNEYYLI